MPSCSFVIYIHREQLLVGVLWGNAVHGHSRGLGIRAESETHPDDLRTDILRKVALEQVTTCLHLARCSGDSDRVVDLIRGIIAYQMLIGSQPLLCGDRQSYEGQGQGKNRFLH